LFPVKTRAKHFHVVGAWGPVVGARTLVVVTQGLTISNKN